jgi:hypothetical protein
LSDWAQVEKFVESGERREERREEREGRAQSGIEPLEKEATGQAQLLFVVANGAHLPCSISPRVPSGLRPLLCVVSLPPLVHLRPRLLQVGDGGDDDPSGGPGCTAPRGHEEFPKGSWPLKAAARVRLQAGGCESLGHLVQSTFLGIVRRWCTHRTLAGHSVSSYHYNGNRHRNVGAAARMCSTRSTDSGHAPLF